MVLSMHLFQHGRDALCDYADSGFLAPGCQLVVAAQGDEDVVEAFPGFIFDGFGHVVVAFVVLR